MEVQALLINTKREQRPATLMRELGSKLKIKWNADGRILLTGKTPAYKGYNGLLLNSNLEIIADPPPRLEKVVPLRKLNISKYKVYSAIDGTLATLYYHNNKWCMSTANGIEVNTYTKFGCTYEEALRSLGFKFEELKQECYYTIVFTHPDFHPLAGGKPIIKLVATDDRDQQVHIEQPITVTVDEMKSKNAASLDKYISDGEVHCGYILRATDSGTSDYFLESKLMCQIRKLAYDLPDDVAGSQTSPANRIKYITLKAYLLGTGTVFTTLFPQFAALQKRIAEFFEDLLVQIVTIISTRAVCRHAPENAIAALAAKLAAYIERHPGCAGNSAKTSIIRDFIHNCSYLVMYYPFVCAMG